MTSLQGRILITAVVLGGMIGEITIGYKAGKRACEEDHASATAAVAAATVTASVGPQGPQGPPVPPPAPHVDYCYIERVDGAPRRDDPLGPGVSQWLLRGHMTNQRSIYGSRGIDESNTMEEILERAKELKCPIREAPKND